jgi:formamidopyrimidine-DNA glycosylase
MPELPEVETLCRQLRNAVLGSRVLEVKTLDPKLGDFKILEGRSITGINRFGKCITLLLEGDFRIAIHLRMTGRLFWSETEEFPRHARFCMRIERGWIFLIDPRRFGTIVLRRGEPYPLASLDALLLPDAEILAAAARSRKISIKTFFLDQKVLAGIGNIYASEILYAAKVDPQKAACALSKMEWAAICRLIPLILKKAISCRGTSVSDWRDLYGRKGVFQKRLMVYGRDKEACARCGMQIRRIVQNGRSTFFCPHCQLSE